MRFILFYRVFLFDCCSGNNERETDRDISDDSKDVGKAIPFEMSKKISLNDINAVTPWIEGENNPDYRLALLEAANPGFQSKLRSDVGSYVIHSFYEKTLKSVKKNKRLFLHQIFDKVQDELHTLGKQHPVYTWNDGTRYIRFKRNGSNNVQKEDSENDEIEMIVFDKHVQNRKEANDDEKVVDSDIDLNAQTAHETIVEEEQGTGEGRGDPISEMDIEMFENVIDEMIDMEM